MDLSRRDMAVVGLYLAVVLILGTMMKRRAARNLGSYFLGENRLPWWALAMSGSSSYFDITGTMWIVGLFVTMGLKGMWVQWIWGFIIPVFYMAYMGKWIRRSGVMTGSEWMETRFGRGPAGELARASYTLYAVLTITAFLAYGATGMGKFGAVFMPQWGEHTCAALILGVTGLYVVIGGFHGVVLVEIFQTLVLSAGALLIACLGFQQVSPEVLAARVVPEWHSLTPRWEFPYLSETEYHLFGALLLVWVVKGMLLSLSGPEQLFDFQRFLAAKDPRDASRLGALWGVIHTVRWPMAMALAVMGIAGLTQTGDPEKVLPDVIRTMLPEGIRGLVLAALLSGFLATFNSTVNGGASYIVKDIYQKYLYPDASEKQLIRASYAASALLIVLGIAVSFAATSIDQMFTWIMGTLGAGVLMPNVLRWYWWRLNGWGYAWGTIAGMVLSLLQALIPASAQWPLYITFPAIAGAVCLITVGVTYATAPTDRSVLLQFYKTVQPAGLWGPVAAEANLPDIPRQFRKDMLNVMLGIPCLIAMWLAPVYLVLHRFQEAAAAALLMLLMCGILYFTWYRRLPEQFAQE